MEYTEVLKSLMDLMRFCDSRIAKSSFNECDKCELKTLCDEMFPNHTPLFFKPEIKAELEQNLMESEVSWLDKQMERLDTMEK